jgi:hypothetical protein
MRFGVCWNRSRTVLTSLRSGLSGSRHDAWVLECHRRPARHQTVESFPTSSVQLRLHHTGKGVSAKLHLHLAADSLPPGRCRRRAAIALAHAYGEGDSLPTSSVHLHMHAAHMFLCAAIKSADRCSHLPTTVHSSTSLVGLPGPMPLAPEDAPVVAFLMAIQILQEFASSNPSIGSSLAALSSRQVDSCTQTEAALPTHSQRRLRRKTSCGCGPHQRADAGCAGEASAGA